MRLINLAILLSASTIPVLAASDADYASAIYSRLARVSGDGRQPPQLQVPPEGRSPDGRRVAWYDPGTRTIGIEAKTVRLCQSMGPRSEACLAFYLGHELAHFYKDHAWAADFGSRFSATPTAGMIRPIGEQQRLTFEAQADDVGVIYGYLAGYDTPGVAGDALSLVYKAYAIAQTSPDYPSLADRQEIARKAAVNLERFVPLFEAGNLLFILGQYKDAAACFDFIARTFASREILNNAGAALAMASAAPDVDWYPWLLDAGTRLRGPRSRSVAAPSEEERKELLESARQRLMEATQRDPEYLPAALNLSLVDDLLGRHGTAADDATAALDLAVKSGTEESARLARLARAIANLHAGSGQRAQADFAGLSYADPLVAHWSAMAAGQAAPARPGEPVQKPGPDETVGGRRPRDVDLSKRQPLLVGHAQIRSRMTAQTTELAVSTPAAGYAPS